jgi:hypothetical protein
MAELFPAARGASSFYDFQDGRYIKEGLRERKRKRGRKSDPGSIYQLFRIGGSFSFYLLFSF